MSVFNFITKIPFMFLTSKSKSTLNSVSSTHKHLNYLKHFNSQKKFTAEI